MLDPKKLRHTICFCVAGDEVLMLYRHKNPNQFFWNGIGGKIELDETPRQGIYREAMEEAGLDLNQAERVDFVGVVSWLEVSDPKIEGGMYAYIAYLPSKHLKNKKEISEGILEYKPISWVIDQKNKVVVKNITYFLPVMLKSKKPYQFACLYSGHDLQKISKKLLKDKLLGV